MLISAQKQATTANNLLNNKNNKTMQEYDLEELRRITDKIRKL